jgi:putative membrane protein
LVSPARAHTTMSSYAQLILAGALLLGTACANHDPASRNDSIVAAGEADYAASHRTIMPPEPAVLAAKAAPPTLDDAGIATLAGESNRREIEIARIAVGKATSGAVKLWARQMIDDHGRNDRDLRDLEKRLDLTEKPSAQSTANKADLDRLKARFAALPKGLAFDTAFVHYEEADHVDEIKETTDLAAKARNADLKKLLTESLVDLERHRDRARILSRLLIAKKQ